MTNPEAARLAIPLALTVQCAVVGDRAAVNALVQALQGDVYGLALRMLANREEAEDAAQEILVRVVTRLSRFDGRSSVRTWAYRVAVNYLLDLKKGAAERLNLSFEHMAEALSELPSGEPVPESEQSLLVEEVKTGAPSACSSAWTGPTGWLTCWARSWNCPDRRPPRSWTWRRTCSASAYSWPAPPSWPSPGPTAGSPRTRRPAAATARSPAR